MCLEGANSTHSAQKFSDEFDLTIWPLHPKREGNNPKSGARKAYNARRREGVESTVMRDGLARYTAYVERKGWVGTDFVMQGATCYGPDNPFLQDWAVATPNVAAVRVWSVMKKYGFANATRFTIDTEIERAVADGKVTDADAFRRTLGKLDCAALCDTRTDEAAYRIFAESLGTSQPEGLVA